MVEAELASAAAQFGVAGLVCWMWLAERRAAAERERQLTESHERIVRRDEDRGVLIDVIRENTRAAASIEAGQRALIRSIDRIVPVAGSSRVETPKVDRAGGRG